MNKSDDKITKAMGYSKQFIASTTQSIFQEGGGLSIIGCEIFNYFTLQLIYGKDKRKIVGQSRNLYNAI